MSLDIHAAKSIKNDAHDVVQCETYKIMLGAYAEAVTACSDMVQSVYRDDIGNLETARDRISDGRNALSLLGSCAVSIDTMLRDLDICIQEKIGTSDTE